MKLKEKWKKFLLENESNHILQTIEWGLAKNNANHSWVPYFLIQTKDEFLVKDKNDIEKDFDKEIKAVAVCLVRDLFMGQKVAYIPRGPVLNYSNEKLLSKFLDKIINFSNKRNIPFVKIEPNLFEDEEKVKEIFSDKGFDITGNFVQVRDTVFVDLTQSKEDMLMSFHSKQRYNIRLAKRRGLTTYSSDDFKELQKFWKLYLKTNDRRDDALNLHKKEYYEEILKVLMPAKLAYFTFVEKEDDVVSASINFKLGEEAIYMYGGFDYKYRRDMPNQLREWQSMVYAKEIGCKRFDLWGLTLRSDPGGIKKYKMRFNEDVKNYIGVFEKYKNPLYKFAINTITDIRGR